MGCMRFVRLTDISHCLETIASQAIYDYFNECFWVDGRKNKSNQI